MLIPQTTMLVTIGMLALAVAPLAYLAALSPSFRVAPFTAIIVLFLSGEFGESTVTSALHTIGRSRARRHRRDPRFDLCFAGTRAWPRT